MSIFSCDLSSPGCPMGMMGGAAGVEVRHIRGDHLRLALVTISGNISNLDQKNTKKTLLLPPANSAKQFWEGCTFVFKPYLVYLTTESKAQRKACSQSDPLRVIAKITINCPLPPFPPTFREKGMQPMTTLSTE